ncbi:MAG: FKBP-type peptidyl-prolyl cis-trans isomerase [Bacteroidales bacterium]
MNFVKSYLICGTLIVLLQACNSPVQEKPIDTDKVIRKSLIETNKYMRERNRELIMAFLNRAEWDMTETPTGLWYMIMVQGDGETVQKGKQVIFAYETRLLSGKICYSADTLTPKKIVVGKGNIETGLEEGLLMLREGSRARFIIPPYLAHGNFGDSQNIPGSAVLITEIQVLEVRR